MWTYASIWHITLTFRLAIGGVSQLESSTCGSEDYYVAVSGTPGPFSLNLNAAQRKTLPIHHANLHVQLDCDFIIHLTSLFSCLHRRMWRWRKVRRWNLHLPWGNHHAFHHLPYAHDHNDWWYILIDVVFSVTLEPTVKRWLALPSLPTPSPHWPSKRTLMLPSITIIHLVRSSQSIVPALLVDTRINLVILTIRASLNFNAAILAVLHPEMQLVFGSWKSTTHRQSFSLQESLSSPVSIMIIFHHDVVYMMSYTTCFDISY